MTPTPIDALCELATQWVEKAFPDDRPVHELARLWTHLASVLCAEGSPQQQMFIAEIARDRVVPGSGAAPTKALAEFIQSAARQGVRELFLAVAIRLTLEQLIHVHVPAHEDTFRDLAERTLPEAALVGRLSSEMPPQRSTYGPA